MQVSLLFQYLLYQQKLSLPGIGTLYMELLPARLEFVNKKLIAPHYVIRYTMEQEPADQNLIDFLVEHTGADEATTQNNFNEWLYQSKQQLDAKGSFSFLPIGTLTKEMANTYSFAPAYNTTDFLPPVAVERISPQGLGHDVRIGDTVHNSIDLQENSDDEIPVPKKYFWLIVTVLSVLSIAAIAAYYLL